MIVPMSKVQVLGPRRLLPEAIQVLHAQRVLQLRSLPEALTAAAARGGAAVRNVPLAPAELASERSLEEFFRRLQDLLLVLPAPHARAPGAALPEVTSGAFASRLDAVEAEVRAVNERLLALEEERDLVARYERLLTALAPLLRSLEGSTHVETVGILLRRDRPDALDLVERQVARITRGAYTLLSREVDEEQVGVLLTVPREFAAPLAHLLFEQGITEVRLPGSYGDEPLVKTLGVLLRRGRELPGEVAAARAELAACSGRWYEPLQRTRRSVRDRLDRLRAMAHCGETDHSFVISGWVPSERRAALVSELEAAFHGSVTLVEHAIREEEYDTVPVVLRNPRLVRPFELLLGLLPPPRYGSVDPTPLLAGFFPLFFGLMLGDVGYGGVALVLALVARAKGWGGEIGRQVTAIAAACSLSAILFGLLFGELFGDLAGRIGLQPLLLDRKHAVLSFLAVALALGGIHVVLGLLLGLWTALRLRERETALAKAATLAAMLAVGLGLLARLDYLPRPIGVGALVALGPLLVVLFALEGVVAPLELMKTMGNVLSYARLMALGMASVMLADVANLMAGLFTTAVVGVSVAVLLHVVNFAMGFFSPVIQALRLHYVEFFDKFYRDGGRPYEPFSLAS